MSKDPFFSVIIPTYNSYDKLLRAIRSVENQTCENFEIIVVDDGSTDGTKTKIEKEHFKKLRYLYKSNGGPASARNVGIREARGKYVCFLDADDEFMPQKLSEYYVACLEDTKFIFSNAEYFDERSNESYIFSSKEYMKYGNNLKSLLEQNFIVASTVCIKKDILENLAVFDERSEFKFVEDYDLWLKIVNKYPLHFISKPLTRYYIHASNNSNNVKRTIRSLRLIYLKWALKSLIATKNFIKYSIVLFFYFLGIKK